MDATDTDKKADLDAIANAAELYEKYAAHGRLDGPRTIVTWPAGVRLDEMPTAFAYANGTCSLIGIAQDYSPLAAAAGTPDMLESTEMKAFLLAHEDMHCRIGTTPVGTDKDGIPRTDQDRVSQGFDSLVNESTADSMAILIAARRDGVASGLNVLEQVRTLRTQGAEEDKIHDSRASLELVEDALRKHPEKFKDDETAFKSAIEIGLTGATKTYPSQLQEGDKKYLQTREFDATLAAQADRFSIAALTYREGAYPATPSMIATINDVKKSYPIEADFGRNKDFGSGPVQEHERRAFKDKIESIQSDVKIDRTLTFDKQNKVTAGENPYLKGRFADVAATGIGMSNSLDRKPVTLRL